MTFFISHQYFLAASNYRFFISGIIYMVRGDNLLSPSLEFL